MKIKYIILSAVLGFIIGNVILGIAYLAYTQTRPQKITVEEYWRLLKEKQIDSIVYQNGFGEIETINGEHFVTEIGSGTQIYLSFLKGQENAANRNIKVIIKPDTKLIELETIFKMAPFYLMSFTTIAFAVWFIVFRKRSHE